MKKWSLFFLLLCSGGFLLGQDSLFLPSGVVVEGDILQIQQDWIIIRPQQTNHPVEITRKGTTYRLGEDYLIRSPWSIGFRYGRTFLGTAQHLHSLFEEHGFNKVYANDRPSVIHLEVEHAMNTRTAYGLTLGYSNKGSINGQKQDVLNNFHGYADVNFRTFSFAPYYKWFSKNHAIHFFGGPVLITNRFNYYPSETNSFEKPVKLGLSAGAEYAILEGRRSFLRLNVQYQWTPSIAMGSIGVMMYDYSSGEPVGEYYEFIPRTNVRTSHLTLNLIYGRKFGR